jgi:hypothetical protein
MEGRERSQSFEAASVKYCPPTKESELETRTLHQSCWLQKSCPCELRQSIVQWTSRAQFRLTPWNATRVPAVLVGAILMLLLTGTTLNLESFMGTIMAIGVAVANAILLVTFAEQSRRNGADSVSAARSAAAERLRPVLMTSLAMIAGQFQSCAMAGPSRCSNHVCAGLRRDQ